MLLLFRRDTSFSEGLRTFSHPHPLPSQAPAHDRYVSPRRPWHIGSLSFSSSPSTPIALSSTQTSTVRTQSGNGNTANRERDQHASSLRSALASVHSGLRNETVAAFPKHQDSEHGGRSRHPSVTFLGSVSGRRASALEPGVATTTTVGRSSGVRRPSWRTDFHGLRNLGFLRRKSWSHDNDVGPRDTENHATPQFSRLPPLDLSTSIIRSPAAALTQEAFNEPSPVLQSGSPLSATFSSSSRSPLVQAFVNPDGASRVTTPSRSRRRKDHQAKLSDSTFDVSLSRSPTSTSRVLRGTWSRAVEGDGQAFELQPTTSARISNLDEVALPPALLHRESYDSAISSPL